MSNASKTLKSWYHLDGCLTLHLLVYSLAFLGRFLVSYGLAKSDSGN
eukprot:SAG31_NODE_4001_length_3676_cov_16.072127_2_plen_47_part_00